MSLVLISALSNFSLVSVGFNLPAWQIASNPRMSPSELLAFCQISFFFFYWECSSLLVADKSYMVYCASSPGRYISFSVTC